MQEEALGERDRRLRLEQEDASATERRAASLLADAETQANRIVRSIAQSPCFLPILSPILHFMFLWDLCNDPIEKSLNCCFLLSNCTLSAMQLTVPSGNHVGVRQAHSSV
jgi:hypothetical protein